jgi:hypothetical protein
MLFRYWRGREIREIRPMTVVEDGLDWLVLWLAPGTPVIWSPLRDGRDMRQASLEERFRLPRVAVPRTWRGTGILKLVPASAPYSVWLFWDDAEGFLGWYGNLEDVHSRWSDGDLRVIDTVDHVLDVWVPTHERPRWKDEDEFAVTTGMAGYWSTAEAAVIRAEGERLMALAGVRRAPFDHTWVTFAPDPSWPLPDLPESWDRLRRE